MAAEVASLAGRPVAWISLGGADNDPNRFLAYLVAAINKARVGLADAVMAMTQSPHPPPPETCVTALINEVARVATPLILVLDDYHVIESKVIHKAVTGEAVRFLVFSYTQNESNNLK